MIRKLPGLILVFLCLFINIISQEIDITDQLKAIESGNIQKAKSDLEKFKIKNPEDPSVLFLDAVLTENGKTALTKYSSIINNFPQGKYADASLFRIYSYYYAAGLYNTAQKYLDQLVDSYPGSPYIKKAQDKIQEDGLELVNEEITNNDLSQDKSLEAEESESARIVPPEAVKIYRFTIQAGAFLVLNNAIHLKDTFEKAGYYSEIKEKKIGGSTFNVVLIGKFETENEAKSFLADINKRHSLNGRVVSFE